MTSPGQIVPTWTAKHFGESVVFVDEGMADRRSPENNEEKTEDKGHDEGQTVDAE